MDIKNSFIPLVIAFTPNYLVPAATCLLSLLDSSDSSDRFHIVCLLSEPLSEKEKNMLTQLNRNRLSFEFVSMQGRMEGIYVNDRYTEAASYRLLLPELLPDFDKVIYIDCDVIIRNNLAQLYCQIDLGNNYLAGVFEATLDFQLLHMKAIGCEPGTYINSGFLVMNLELLRKDQMVSKFLEASKNKELEFPDQDVLNQLCKGRVLGLEPYFNGIRTFFLPQYKPNFLQYYSKEDWEEVQAHGTVHYTGAKPWNSLTIEFSTWWNYYEKLPKAFKQLNSVNSKMYYLYKIVKNPIGSSILKAMQFLYRKIK